MSQEKIFFITDSACDIPAKNEQELENLSILPIPVTADGKGYYERESFTPEEFYDLMDLQIMLQMMALKSLLQDGQPKETVEKRYKARVRILRYGVGNGKQAERD